MHFTKALIIASLACLAGAIPSSRHVLHERRQIAPRHWEKTSRLNPNAVLPMRIGLTQSNLDKGDLLMEV
jgi:tripeptidyl-peptidase-1